MNLKYVIFSSANEDSQICDMVLQNALFLLSSYRHAFTGIEQNILLLQFYLPCRTYIGYSPLYNWIIFVQIGEKKGKD